MTRAYSKWLQLALGFALIFSTGCGDSNDGRDANGGGDAGDRNGGGDSEEFIADTSGFNGLLTWTLGMRSGLFVWDLPKSELIFEHRGALGEAEGERFPTLPALSRDGKTLAYTLEDPFVIALLGEVVVRELATGKEEIYPSSDLGPNHQRITTNPSISGDGRIVAVTEKNFEWIENEFGRFPENETRQAIQIWDRASGELTYVTDGSFRADAPRLSVDGSRVLFLSDELSEVDFYIANTAPPFNIERLTNLAEEPGIALAPNLARAPGHISASDDLRYLAFVVSDEDKTTPIAIIVDTETKTTKRAIIRPVGVELKGELSQIIFGALALSGDGNTIAYSVHFIDIIEEKLNGGRQILRAPRATPEEMSIVDADDDAVSSGLDPSGLALSPDGSQIAYSLRLNELWVNLIDGSDPRQVVHEEQKRVGPDFGLSMSLSF